MTDVNRLAVCLVAYQSTELLVASTRASAVDLDDPSRTPLPTDPLEMMSQVAEAVKRCAAEKSAFHRRTLPVVVKRCMTPLSNCPAVVCRGLQDGKTRQKLELLLPINEKVRSMIARLLLLSCAFVHLDWGILQGSFHVIY